MSPHAFLSASGAHRWMRCAAAPWLEAAVPDLGSGYAAEGTLAHELAATLLLGTAPPLGPDDDMVRHVAHYAVLVEDLREGGTLLVEQGVPIGHITGEVGALGTADAIIISRDGTAVTVVDLKYGKGVKIGAEGNEQLMLYALGALEVVTLLGYEPTTARLVIFQPRIVAEPDEWVVPVAELRAFAERAAQAAELTRAPRPEMLPGEKQCRFCRAKATCPALAEMTMSMVIDDFVDLDAPLMPQVALATERIMDPVTLGNCMGVVDLIEQWCRAVRGRVEAELLAGVEVPGWKLVQGRRGNRQWADEAQAGWLVEGVLGDAAWSKKLISPTQVEKLAKAAGMTPDLAPLVIQAEGKPSVASADDPRPTLVPGAIPADFAVIETAE